MANKSSSKKGAKSANQTTRGRGGKKTAAKSKQRRLRKRVGQSPITITGGSFTIELQRDPQLGDRHLVDLDIPPQGRRFQHEDTNKKVRTITINAPGATVAPPTGGSSTTTINLRQGGQDEGFFQLTFFYR